MALVAAILCHGTTAAQDDALAVEIPRQGTTPSSAPGASQATLPAPTALPAQTAVPAQQTKPQSSTESLPAQDATPAPASDAETAEPSTSSEAHRGQIVIQSHGEPPSVPSEAVPPPISVPQEPVVGEGAKADISDAERAAPTVVAYDLDLRLDLQRAGLESRARITVRNDGAAALRQIPLQISSSLQWQSATLLGADGRTPLKFAQHRLDTDADHTGAANEIILPLPVPLAPGAIAVLDLFYGGTVPQNSARLERIGADAAQGRSADWDAIGSAWTGLRGFGNVLWYPVASPQLFLQEGNTLFTAIGRMRRLEEAATMQLRLGVTYAGEPPVAVYFCGRRADLKAVADDPNAPTAQGAGLATAQFATEPLGFRLPSLFLIQQPEVLLGDASAAAEAAPTPDSVPATGISSSNPSPAPEAPSAAPGSSSDSLKSSSAVAESLPAVVPLATPVGPIVALASSDGGIAAGLHAAADRAATLDVEWLGQRPLSALTVIDHPGQPFQDGPLLVAPAATLETSPEQPALVYSLTHAWLQTGQPWMDDGLSQFLTLLWAERNVSREAALAQLNELMQPVALAEPDLSSAMQTTVGQPLITASDELFYRRKASAVWWMLRDIAGEKPLKAALAAWRTQPASAESAAAQAQAFERLLSKLSGKDLQWFFADWVLRDRGLPDLSIAGVETSQTPAGAGHNTGWLVAVTVRNEGGAAAEVPVIVRSGKFSSTERLRIPGFSQATQRVLTESAPTEVIVNDGSTPEVRVATHIRQIAAASLAP